MAYDGPFLPILPRDDFITTATAEDVAAIYLQTAAMQIAGASNNLQRVINFIDPILGGGLAQGVVFGDLPLSDAGRVVLCAWPTFENGLQNERGLFTYADAQRNSCLRLADPKAGALRRTMRTP